MYQKGLIQKLYQELHIEEKLLPKNPRYKQAVNEAERCLSQLMDTLSEEQSSLIEAYQDAIADQTIAYDEEVFCMGFRYGAQIMREILG